MGSGLSRSLRRVVVLALSAGLATVGLGAVLAPSASAASSTRVGASSWAYADSASPGTSHVEPAGDVPVGAHQAAHGPDHVTKAYFTFDLSQFMGTDLVTASLLTSETAVADCSVATAPQAWLTDTDTRPTWTHQPAERSALGAVGQSGCPSANVGWDATLVLRDAMASGRSTATLVVRLPESEQRDPAHGITIGSDTVLLVQDNGVPVATGLTVQRTACGAQPVLVGKLLSTVGMTLSATVTDPDGDGVTAEFDWWPAADPAQRHVVDAPDEASGTTPKVTLLPSQLADATTYDWQVRATDGTDTGPFSAVCQFSTEFTTPPEAPVVTSTDYPASQTGPGTGGSGETGTFTFAGSGDPDITGFAYGVSGIAETFVTADQPGGTATVQFTPADVGPASLTVFTVDRAGDLGTSVTYQFWVANNEPVVSCTPASAFIGVPRQCAFAPRSTDVVGYQYQLGDGPVSTVQAAADGTANVTVTPTDPNTGLFLHVRAQLANGNLTEEILDTLQTDSAPPTVDQGPAEALAGTPVRFVFTAALPGSVSFTYTIDGGTPVTVPADPDGTATVTLTPDTSFLELDVFSTTADGVDSGTTTDFPFLDTDEPTVTSTDYPEGSLGGGVGQPGTFTFTSPVPGVVSYTYDFNGDEETVPAGPDGSAQVVLTPMDTSEQELLVSSTLPDGGTSDETFYAFGVNSSAESARLTK